MTNWSDWAEGESEADSPVLKWSEWSDWAYGEDYTDFHRVYISISFDIISMNLG